MYLQVCHWVSIIVIQRTLIGLIFLCLATPLNGFGTWALSPLHGNANSEILFVVVFWPPLTAITEFWIQDNFLKQGGGCYCCSPPAGRKGGSSIGTGDLEALQHMELVELDGDNDASSARSNFALHAPSADI